MLLGNRVFAEKTEIEVACFKGGYGIDFYEKCAREYETSNPQVKINVWGNPKVWEQLVPRFASGDTPDLVWPGPDMNVFAVIFDGQLTQLDKYLDKPALGVDKPWRDTFVQTMLNKGSYQGHIYTVPYNFDSTGWWYNKKMFQQHGWKPPQTYEEMLTLSDAINKEKIAPIAFTGRIAQYMLDGLFFPYVYRAGGQPVLVGSSRVDLQACKLEYSIVSPK